MTHPIGRSSEESTGAAGGVTKPQNYRSKMVRPKAVTKTGSYFRVINQWFSAQNRHLALLIGKNLIKQSWMLADTVTRPSGTTLRHSTTKTPAWQLGFTEIMPISMLFKPCVCSMILKILRTLITLKDETWRNLCDTSHINNT